MGALRKAGVWLGLIEDDDEYPERGYDHRGYDDYDEDEDEVVPVRPRAAERLAEQARTDARRRTPGADAAGCRETRHTETRHTETRHTGTRHPEVRHTDSGREALRGEPAQVRPRCARWPGRRRRSAPRPATRPGTTWPWRRRSTLRERPMLAEPEERRYQITTLHPTTYHEARTVGEHFRDGRTGDHEPDRDGRGGRRRLVDFAAGLAFGLRGTWSASRTGSSCSRPRTCRSPGGQDEDRRGWILPHTVTRRGITVGLSCRRHWPEPLYLAALPVSADAARQVRDGLRALLRPPLAARPGRGRVAGGGVERH